ncbi:Cu(I)/Ag(I) efflux system protein CusF [Pseudomonas duriflava]|uniref:Cu(I)/Ag(I) efflux system protein CusF n=1 Tax=Pseudomonas duriflava TaxID=459528 RepID=A0A562PXY1_9PSED|nr:copper-binding protein [Pseudomonas duriflava]TWI49264.1 Cu(I)/Ag(I) efflux system protein CusF [Pseudomonas duriflava]
MKRTFLAISALVFVAPVFAAETHEMPMKGMTMEKAQAATEAKASGTVKSINTEKGTVTISHGPVPEVQWPAMTMPFKATPDQLNNVKQGDKIDFTFKSEGMSATITSIKKQ